LCFFFLAAFCWLTEVRRWRKWAFPLVVIGMNSMAAYVIAHLWQRFIVDSFRIHLGRDLFQVFGTGAEPLLQGMAVLLVYWLVLFWMYRRKLFLKV
jgi:predicted acyltransferase